VVSLYSNIGPRKSPAFTYRVRVLRSLVVLPRYRILKPLRATKSLALIGNPRRTPVGVKNRMHIAADFR